MQSEERIKKMYTPPSVDPQSRQRDLKERDRDTGSATGTPSSYGIYNHNGNSNTSTMGERPRPLVEIQEISDHQRKELTETDESDRNKTQSMSITNEIKSLSMQNSYRTSTSVLNADGRNNSNNDQS